MFFKQPVLKRMLKSAYKGAGLTVGHAAESESGIPEGYYISSGWWVVWILAEKMPKEIKAAIIELCGDLPEVGEAFHAKKDAANQYEIEQKEIYNLPEGFMECGCNFRVTKLLGQQRDEKIRFIQEERTQRVTAVNEIFIDLINPNAADYENGETALVGPVARVQNPGSVYWGNNTCYLLVCTRYTNTEEEKEFWEFLEKTEIL